MLSVSNHIFDSLGGQLQLPVMMTESNELKPLVEFLPLLQIEGEWWKEFNFLGNLVLWIGIVFPSSPVPFCLLESIDSEIEKVSLLDLG